jgi:hypothetical protein
MMSESRRTGPCTRSHATGQLVNSVDELLNSSSCTQTLTAFSATTRCAMMLEELGRIVGRLTTDRSRRLNVNLALSVSPMLRRPGI